MKDLVLNNEKDVEAIILPNIEIKYPDSVHMPSYIFGIVCRGRLTLRRLSQNKEYFTGDWFYILPDEIHSMWSNEPVTLLYFCVNKNVVFYKGIENLILIKIKKAVVDSYDDESLSSGFSDLDLLYRIDFKRLFRKSTGMNIKKFLIFTRILYAQQLSITTNKTFLEISNEVGFTKFSEFKRFYKKYLKVCIS